MYSIRTNAMWIVLGYRSLPLLATSSNFAILTCAFLTCAYRRPFTSSFIATGVAAGITVPLSFGDAIAENPGEFSVRKNSWVVVGGYRSEEQHIKLTIVGRPSLSTSL